MAVVGHGQTAMMPVSRRHPSGSVDPRARVKLHRDNGYSRPALCPDRAIRQRHAGARRSAHDVLGDRRQPDRRAGPVSARRTRRRLLARASALLRSGVLPRRAVRPARRGRVDAARRIEAQHHAAADRRHRDCCASTSGSSAGWCSAGRGAARSVSPMGRRIRIAARGFLLRGIFLGRQSEIDWFLYGLRQIFPEAWRNFAGMLPEEEHGDLLRGYLRRLFDPDPRVQLSFARAWSEYEGSCSTLAAEPGAGAPLCRRGAGPGTPRGALLCASLFPRPRRSCCTTSTASHGIPPPSCTHAMT